VSEQVTRATDLTGTLVLKHDRMFLVTDAFGDIRTDQRGLGLYTGDTRVLSRLELRIDGQRPLVLRTGTGAGYHSTIQMTNPDLARNPLEKGDASATLARQSLGIVRERGVVDGLDERVRIHNYTMHVDRCLLTLTLDADFADIFEVRGVRRPARGERAPAEVTAQSVLFTYRGLDDRVRRTLVELSEPGSRPDAEAGSDVGPSGGVTLGFDWTIRPGEDRSLSLRVTSEVVEDRPAATQRREPRPSLTTPHDPEAAHRAWRATSTSITSSHAGVERALRRGMADLRLLVDPGPGEGERYIAAGIPWYDTLFGRDSIISALQLLSIRPQVASDTLSILARLQATTSDDWRDAEPGKILHELRTGEMALAHEIPHTPYYGSVDSTPLFLVLLAEYERWTDDMTACGPRPSRRSSGSTTPVMRTATGSWSTAAAPSEASATRAGRIPRTRSAGRTVAWRRDPSRWSRSRATSTRRGWAWRGSPGGEATRHSRRGWSRPRKSCAAASRRRSGSMARAPTRWPSTGRSAPWIP
jgi:glycogen debranching enzyme